MLVGGRGGQHEHLGAAADGQQLRRRTRSLRCHSPPPTRARVPRWVRPPRLTTGRAAGAIERALGDALDAAGAEGSPRRQGEPLAVSDEQVGAAQRRQRVTIQVAPARQQRVHRGHGVLGAARQPTARTCSRNSSWPSAASQRRIRRTAESTSGTVAEHEGGHDRVERSVVEAGLVDAGSLHLVGHAGRGEAGQQAPAHGAVGLERHDFGHGRGRVMGDVEPGAGADLEDPSPGAGQQPVSPLGQSPLLGPGQEAVVGGGEQRDGRPWRRHRTGAPLRVRMVTNR